MSSTCLKPPAPAGLRWAWKFCPGCSFRLLWSFRFFLFLLGLGFGSLFGGLENVRSRENDRRQSLWAEVEHTHTAALLADRTHHEHTQNISIEREGWGTECRGGHLASRDVKEARLLHDGADALHRGGIGAAGRFAKTIERDDLVQDLGCGCFAQIQRRHWTGGLGHGADEGQIQIFVAQ